MTHIGFISPNPSDKWADMPEIPKEDYNTMTNHERKVMGCLYLVVGVVMIFATLLVGILSMLYLYS